MPRPGRCGTDAVDRTASAPVQLAAVCGACGGAADGPDASLAAPPWDIVSQVHPVLEGRTLRSATAHCTGMIQNHLELWRTMHAIRQRATQT